MDHITEPAWADFVRGSSTPEAKLAIESHLASGCAVCRSAAGLWESFMKIALAESQYTPSPDTVRLVQAQFAAAKVAVAPRSFPGLVFDSFAQPLRAGMRSGTNVARQLVYEADGLTIDLRIDKHANSKALSIVGQVLDARTLRLAPQAVPVALLNRQGEPLQRTSTSDFGEFHLEVAAETEMSLAIQMDSGHTVCITLPTGACDRSGDFSEQNRLRPRKENDYTGK